MKKMNKMYEAPVAEVFEMQMPTVLMISDVTAGSSEQPGGDNPFGA